MSEKPRPSLRFLVSCIVAASMLASLVPSGQAGGAVQGGGREAPRAVDDGNDLIVLQGETYFMSGCHTYAVSVQINGTVKVAPYDGGNETTGVLALEAPRIIVGPTGRILGDGRGFGGGGGGQNSDVKVLGGAGGSDGTGGAGQDSYTSALGWAYPDAGGGGGGSNGGPAGKPGGSKGNENRGGGGGSGTYGQGGAGGNGFGAGGGGGGGGITGQSEGGGAGGGGGGGCGGVRAVWNTGGDGAGPFGGTGGAGVNSGGGGTDGNNGGYLGKNSNGDDSTDMSVERGSGGGGGGTTSDMHYGGGGGAGGAGGAAVSLLSGGELTIQGSVTTTGGGGGTGGYGYKQQAAGGGGGAGGGIALSGDKVTISGTLDARGRQRDTLSTANGGTVKIFYTEKVVTGTVQSGKTYTNGRPVMGKLLYPGNDSFVNSKPNFNWSAAVDPDGDQVKYELLVAKDFSFSSVVLDRKGLLDAALTPADVLPDGDYYWKVRGEDRWGFGRWTGTWRFTVDTVAPRSAVFTLPAFTTTTSFSVSWSGTDDRAGISNYTVFVSDDQGGYVAWLDRTAATAGNFVGQDGHNYAFYSSAVDRAGNRQNASDVTIVNTTVDASPPVSSLAALEPYQTDANFTIAWSVRDNTSGVHDCTVFFSTDGGDFGVWQDNVTSRSALFTGGDGHSYKFYVRSRDNAGNLEDVPDGTMWASTAVDLAPPTTTLTVGTPSWGEDPVYIAPTTTLTLKASDGYSGIGAIYYKVDGGDGELYTGPVTDLPGMWHNLTYWSLDKAHNAESPGTLWLYVDGDPPHTSVAISGPNHTKGGVLYVSPSTVFILSASDDGCGVGSVQYALDGAEFLPYIGPFGIDKVGAHTLQFMSSDRLGNREATRNLGMTVDSLPPTSSAVEAADTANGTVTVTISASDATSGLAGSSFRVLRETSVAQGWTNGTVAVIGTPGDHSADGNYTVEYYSVDNVGNRETVRSLKFTIDTVVGLIVDQKERTTTGSDRFILSGTVEKGGRVSVNGMTAQVQSDGSFSVEVPLKEGRNTLTLVATDPAGNEATKVYTVTYDKPSSNGGGLVLPIAIVIIVAAAVVAVAVMMRRKGRKEASQPPAPAASPQGAQKPGPPPQNPSPPKDLTP